MSPAGEAVANQGAIVAGGDLYIEAGQSIENVSGRIEGDNVSLDVSEGSIVNRRATEAIEVDEWGLRYNATAAGEAGVIEARNRLELNASQSITVEGSSVSGQEITLEADSIEIETTRESEDFFAGDDDGHFRESTVRHIASAVDGENIVIFSPGSVRVSGSQIVAQDQLRIEAGEIEVAAVTDSEFYADRDTDEGIASTSVRSMMSYRSANRASELDGATVVLITEQGDVELTGSNLLAGEHLEVDSAGAIRVYAGNRGSFDETYEYESSWLSGGSLYSQTEDIEGRMSNSAVKSRIHAASVRLDAEQEINLKGVDAAVRDSFNRIGRGYYRE